jgi:O-antigen ligase
MDRSIQSAHEKQQGSFNFIDLLPRVEILATLWVVLVAILGIGFFVAPLPTVLVASLLGLGLPAVFLLWNQPYIGLIGIIFLTSSFVRPDLVDLRLPIGGLDFRDLMLLGMLGLLVLKGLTERTFTIPAKPIAIPLLVFFGLAGFSVVYSLIYEGVEPNWIFNELRGLSYYFVFFLAAWSLKNLKQIRTLLMTLYVLADITVVVIIIQQFFGRGTPVLSAMTGNWHVWQAEGASGGFGSVRVIPPGHFLIYILMILSFCMAVASKQSPRSRFFYSTQFVFLNFGLLFTYTRAQWIAAVIAITLLLIFLPTTDKSIILRFAAAGCVLLFIVTGIFGREIQQFLVTTPFVTTITDRALSIFTPQQTLATYSLQWRVYETGEALRSIGENPIFGVGLGNRYRDLTLLQYQSMGTDNLTRFVHNSYLYIATKLGIPGLLAFLSFCVAFFWYGWLQYRYVLTGSSKRIAAAFLASFAGILAWAITEPHLLFVQSTAVIGLMAGVLESLRHLESSQQPFEGR